MPTFVAIAQPRRLSTFSLAWQSVAAFLDRVAARAAKQGSVEPFGL